MENDLDEIWDSIKFGETVLVEHSSLASPVKGLYHLIEWAKRKGYGVIVDDILDTLYLYRIHMKLAGYDESILDSITVIKEGGKVNVGSVVKRFPIEEPSVYEQEYGKIFSSVVKGKVINPVVGFEKLLFLANSKQDLLSMINITLSFCGNDKRIAFYFVNADMAERINPEVMPLLEEVATTVIRIIKEGTSHMFMVLKSVNENMEGMKVRV
ncbi:DUF257 family protein [Thermococcus barophilus]|uniref:KaiC-like domain-containing protein n=1 Tax=Thermococcus barophilus (strain DSM 11836 / MP) TaxID=391623 RepID=F0LL46_THEBM|nr:DUF257 family protein [Thermococcus barophilus]ADT84953.1 hypothetical protein TERMP_01979 [Thermococcus barophilus MP]